MAMSADEMERRIRKLEDTVAQLLAERPHTISTAVLINGNPWPVTPPEPRRLDPSQSPYVPRPSARTAWMESLDGFPRSQ